MKISPRTSGISEIGFFSKSIVATPPPPLGSRILANICREDTSGEGLGMEDRTRENGPVDSSQGFGRGARRNGGGWGGKKSGDKGGERWQMIARKGRWSDRR